METKRMPILVDLVVLTLLLGAAVVFARTMHLLPVWTDVFIYTVGVFGIVIVVLRSEWRRTRFWSTLLLLFALHILCLFVIAQALPHSWRGIPGGVQLVAGIAEALVVANIVWIRTRPFA